MKTEVEITKTDSDELEVTIRGKSSAVIQALVQGLTREGLMQIRDAMDAELEKEFTKRHF